RFCARILPRQLKGNAFMSRRSALFLSCAILIALQVLAQQSVKTSNPATDWPMFSHDLSGTRFSQLKQITAKNVATLKLAWSMPYRANRTGGAGGGGVGGVLKQHRSL